MNNAIKLAIEKGGYRFPLGTTDDELEGMVAYLETHWPMVVVDPLFWHSLGKALGNKNQMICDYSKCDSKLCEYAGYKDPKRIFDSYMECIWYGYDEEKF